MSQRHRLVEELSVFVHRLGVELESQLFAKFTVRGILREWDQMRVGNGDLVFSGCLIEVESVDKRIGKPVQLFACDQDPVV